MGVLLTGLVVSELLERDCLYPRIKYPNDVLVNGKKIAGVLTEAREDYVVVGIGMNLNMSNLPEVDSKMKPTSFYLETDCSLDVKSYAQTLQKGVSDLLTCESPLLFRREVEKRLAWKGEMISLRNKTESLEGVLSGLGEYGQLILENVTGVREVSDAYEIRPLSNGK